ncbi:MAG: chorismate mutase [Candidatus Eisenbacteria bacterium]|nr:chorismate mutase [Candidatus Eisenbacteria bacterium]
MTNQMRGIRGAARVAVNTREAILTETRSLLEKMVAANAVETGDIASIFFTTTPDLNSEFPAYAARDMGWRLVPVLCAREIDVPQGMSGVVRILMHVNTSRGQEEIRHIYEGETATLRPDLSEGDAP